MSSPREPDDELIRGGEGLARESREMARDGQDMVRESQAMVRESRSMVEESQAMARDARAIPVNILCRWNDERPVSHGELAQLLANLSDAFTHPLGERVDLGAYAKKLLERAELAVLWCDERPVGLLAIYANDPEGQNAYIPLLGIFPSFQGRGLGKVLVSEAIARVRPRGFHYLRLATKTYSARAVRVYEACGFQVDAQVGEVWEMHCKLR